MLYDYSKAPISRWPWPWPLPPLAQARGPGPGFQTRFIKENLIANLDAPEGQVDLQQPSPA